MLYRLLADLVTLLHLGFVVFVVLGGTLAFVWPKVSWLHLPAAAWGVWIEFSGRICPLTPLEIWLRQQGGAAGYEGGFVEHYLIPVLYPASLTSGVQILLGSVVVVINLAVYGLLWRRHQRLANRAGGA